MHRRTSPALGPAAALLLGLTACAGGEPPVAPSTPAEATPTSSTSTYPATSAPPAGAAASTSTPSTAPTADATTSSRLRPAPPSECEHQSMDLASTAFGAWLGSQVIPTDDPGTHYSFTVEDNRFHPCAALSWVTLTGHNGGPGGEPADALVFFSGIELIAAPLPRQATEITSVERVSTGEITVTYGEGGQVDYHLTDGQLQAAAPLPPALADAVRLDLTRAGPPVEGAPLPFGNAHHRPWDERRPPGQKYSVMLGAPGSPAISPPSAGRNSSATRSAACRGPVTGARWRTPRR